MKILSLRICGIKTYIHSTIEAAKEGNDKNLLKFYFSFILSVFECNSSECLYTQKKIKFLIQIKDLQAQLCRSLSLEATLPVDSIWEISYSTL